MSQYNLQNTPPAGVSTPNLDHTAIFTQLGELYIKDHLGNVTLVGPAAGTSSGTLTLNLSGDVNDVNTGSSAYVKLVPTADRYSITGVAARSEGTAIILYNSSDEFSVLLPEESASSSAANRFRTANRGLEVPPLSTLRLFYLDGRWINGQTRLYMPQELNLSSVSIERLPYLSDRHNVRIITLTGVNGLGVLDLSEVFAYFMVNSVSFQSLTDIASIPSDWTILPALKFLTMNDVSALPFEITDLPASITDVSIALSGITAFSSFTALPSINTLTLNDALNLTSISLVGMDSLTQIVIGNGTGQIPITALDMSNTSHSNVSVFNTLATELLFNPLYTLNSAQCYGNENLSSVIGFPGPSGDNVIISFAGAALPEAVVDELLVACDNSGYSNGNINLSGGTSSTYSGVVGLAAYNSLISKGWSVFTN